MSTSKSMALSASRHCGDGRGNALDFRLGRLRSQYDLSQDAQRLEYVKQAVDLLAERSSPQEQEVYAGRLAEETTSPRPPS